MIKIKTLVPVVNTVTMIIEESSDIEFKIDGEPQVSYISKDGESIVLFNTKSGISYEICSVDDAPLIWKHSPFSTRELIRDHSWLDHIEPKIRCVDSLWLYDKDEVQNEEKIVDCVPGLIIDCSLDSFYGEFGHCSLGPSSQIPGDYQASVIATEIRSSSALLYTQIISDGIARGLVFCTRITDHGNACGVHAEFEDIRLKIEGLSLELGGEIESTSDIEGLVS